MPNANDLGENVGARSVPVPFSTIVAGLFLALLVMVRLPVRVPCAVGVKVTPTVQLESVVPLGCRMVEPLRLQGFAPVLLTMPKPLDGVMLSTVIATVLGFVSVAVLTVVL